jgi:hypothetical protein
MGLGEKWVQGSWRMGGCEAPRPVRSRTNRCLQVHYLTNAQAEVLSTQPFLPQTHWLVWDHSMDQNKIYLPKNAFPCFFLIHIIEALLTNMTASTPPFCTLWVTTGEQSLTIEHGVS